MLCYIYELLKKYKKLLTIAAGCNQNIRNVNVTTMLQLCPESCNKHVHTDIWRAVICQTTCNCVTTDIYTSVMWTQCCIVTIRHWSWTWVSLVMSSTWWFECNNVYRVARSDEMSIIGWAEMCQTYVTCTLVPTKNKSLVLCQPIVLAPVFAIILRQPAAGQKLCFILQ